MKKGIISAGTWLVDCVKFITKYPVSGNLTIIQKEEIGLGGCAHNVLVDIAKMRAGIPLYAGGCIGTDVNGDYILSEIHKHGIDDSYIYRIEDTDSSYTYVMASVDDNSRTFFHYKGTNSLFEPKHIEAIDIPAKIFHLGYLLLLDELEKPDAEYGIAAARVLHHLREKGYKTSVDVVSEESERFRNIMLPCLPYIDYLIIN